MAPPASAFEKVILCSGHMIDRPGRPVPRFPAAKESAVRKAIARQLAAWKVGSGDLAVCGGARGADILFAEECLQRGAPVRLLLAKDVDAFVESSVRLAGSDWVERFHRLRECCEVETLPVQSGALPHLEASGDVYARTNLWIISTARAAAFGSGAIHALLVWDEKSTADGPGGTADFAERVRQLGAHRAIINPTTLAG